MNWELDKLKLNNIVNVMKNVYRSQAGKGIITMKVPMILSDKGFWLSNTYISEWDAMNNIEVRKVNKGYVIGFLVPEAFKFVKYEDLPEIKDVQNFVFRTQIEDPEVYDELKLKFNQDISLLEKGGSLTTQSDLYKEAIRILDMMRDQEYLAPSLISVPGGPSRPPKDMMAVYNIDGETGDVYIIKRKSADSSPKFMRYSSSINLLTSKDIQDTCKRVRWNSMTLTLKGPLREYFFKYNGGITVTF